MEAKLFRIRDMKKVTSIAHYRSRAESLSGVLEVAASLGRDIEPILLKHGFSLDLLNQPDADISYNALCQLHEDCAAQWSCPDFGLRMARVQNINILGPVGLIARLSDTVGEALKALNDRMVIHSTGYSVSLDEGDSASGRPASISYTPKPKSDSGQQIVELSLGITRNVLATAAGMPEFKPLRVTFRHPMPAYPEAASRFFKAPVQYGAADNTLYFDPTLLQLPTAIRDTAYAPIIRAYLEQMRPRIEQDIIALSNQLIAKLLATGRCSREAVADCLHLHPRTYQRRLSDEGVTFKELLDDYRKVQAKDLVTRKTMSLVHIADALGYADQSSFHQAFKRWTGTSPMKFRQANLLT